MKVITITGAVASGKTYTLDMLKKAHQDLGRQVIAIDRFDRDSTVALKIGGAEDNAVFVCDESEPGRAYLLKDVGKPTQLAYVSISE